MLVVALVGSILLGLLRGGDLSRIAKVNLKGHWLYVSGFLLQVMLNWTAPKYVGILYSLSFLLLLAGAYVDRHIRSMNWVILGIALNAVVIAFNGGKMPVRIPEPLFTHDIRVVTHAPITASTRFWVLSDVAYIPLLQGRYLMISIGDALIAIGVCAIIQRMMLVDERENRARIPEEDLDGKRV
jgi:hypothetical protein